MSLIKGINIVAETGEKQSYVVAGAILSCSFGDKFNRLKMPFSHGVYIKGKPQMNIMDYVPNVNIMPFGKCSSLANPAVASATAANNGVLTPQPCTPMTTMPWIDGKTDVLVEGHPALLNKCTNCCLYAGIIKIEDDGQALSLTVSKQAKPVNSRDEVGTILTKGSPLSETNSLIPSVGTVQNNKSNNWNQKIAANWTINELMEKEATSEEKRQEYARKAENLRQRLRDSGVPEDQILQATSSYIPNNQVMEIAQANVEKRIKDDPLGFGLITKGYQGGILIGSLLSKKSRRTSGVSNNKASTLERNRENGKLFEKELEKKLEEKQNVAGQVTIKTHSGTKTRVDFIGTDKETGEIKITEGKSSKTAPLTKNQKKAFPEIETDGGVVVGKGKPPFTKGTRIPPTKIDIIRPQDLLNLFRKGKKDD